MIQRLVISLIHVITNTFFRRIDVVGIENVPAEGPVSFAGNHQNALMDGWLLTARFGRGPRRGVGAGGLGCDRASLGAPQ